MALISVLMPAFNAEKFIGAAISSILDQSFSDFELIIIDDGSTDQTESIISSFNDHRIRLYKNNHNRGLSESLNWGISLATTPILARMDADDISTLDRFKIQYDFLKKNPDIGLVGSWIEGFGEVNRKYIHRYPVNHDAIVASMIFENPIAHPSVMLRKNILENLESAYTNRYPWVEDWELWWRLKNITKIENIPKVLLKYRITGGSVNHRHASKQHESTIQLLNHFLQDAAMGGQFSPDYICKPKSLAECIKQEFYLKRLLQSNLGDLFFNHKDLERIVQKFFYANCIDSDDRRWLLATFYVSSPLVKKGLIRKIWIFFKIVCGYYVRKLLRFAQSITSLRVFN
jgi:glycosyltransferase involved in cell wall biosynthesis